MSGGLVDAVERLADQQLDGAEAGYAWLGLEAAAEVVRFVRGEVAGGSLDDPARAHALESEADRRYAELVPADAALVAAFTTRLAELPEAFAPA